MINHELEKVPNLSLYMISFPNFNKISTALKSDLKFMKRKHTMVIDIENTLVTRIKIRNQLELLEIRNTSNYMDRFIEVKTQGPVKVFMVRPYTYEFLRALQPYFEIIAYSRLNLKVI